MESPQDTAHPAGPEAPAAVPLHPAACAEIERFRMSHDTQVLTIFFCDLVGSTRAQSDLGNIRAAELVRLHRAVLRKMLAVFDCAEIETAGDSMLVVFAAPSAAVKCALYVEQAMREARKAEPALPCVRYAVHQGQVVVEKRAVEAGEGRTVDIYGIQVSTTARIMDLGGACQILCSRSVFDDARSILRADDLGGLGTVAWRNHGPYRFKGVDESYEVCEVGEEGFAPLAPPPAGVKGWPAGDSSEELGWRPAAGCTVPGSSWVLMDKLGEGAFGEVWKAFSPAIKSHQVYKFCFKRERLPALKREARLLKKLRRYAHPNIVEVYDVTEGERPPHYLEMEYVDGLALGDWLCQDPPLRDRLEVVAQVADALDTVHAAGIYHRDIKPGNILVTRREDGAVLAKLTDFGLGAAEDSDLLKSIEASRDAAGASGTWDYIAPELRHGDRASARSDIYSLGLTLFQVVAGDPDRPFTADWESQVPTAVLADDIRRCVARSPEDRWPRAAELAQALRSHDQRVRARELEAERERQRIRTRRLRRAVAAAAGVAVVTAALGGVALWQWREAEHQRDRAVAQKRLAIEAVRKLTHDVPTRLKDIPGTLPVLTEIIEENIGMLDRILDLEPDTTAAKRERVVNCVSAGDRWMLLGDTSRALASYEDAFMMARDLAASDPGEKTFQRDLANTYDRLGKVMSVLGRTAEALDAFEKSMVITRELSSASPATAETRRDLWFAYDRLGGIYLEVGRTADALSAYEQTLAISRGLSEEDPKDLQALRAMSVSCERVGDVKMEMGRTAEALASYQAGMEQARRLVALRPESAEARRDLSVGYDKLGSVYLRLDRAEEALKCFEESMEIARALAAEDPENMELQRDLAVCLDRIGDAQLRLGRTRGALETYRQGLDIAKALADKDPKNPSSRHDLVAAFTNVGNALLAESHSAEALAAYEDGLAIAEELAAADPAQATVQRTLSVMMNKVGDAQLLAGHPAAAAARYADGLAVAEKLAAADPGNMTARRDVAFGYYKLMLAQRNAGDLARWRSSARGALEAFAAIYEASGGDGAARADLESILNEVDSGVKAMPGPVPEDLQAALDCARRALSVPPAPAP